MKEAYFQISAYFGLIFPIFLLVGVVGFFVVTFVREEYEYWTRLKAWKAKNKQVGLQNSVNGNLADQRADRELTRAQGLVVPGAEAGVADAFQSQPQLQLPLSPGQTLDPQKGAYNDPRLLSTPDEWDNVQVQQRFSQLVD